MPALAALRGGQPIQITAATRRRREYLCASASLRL